MKIFKPKKKLVDMLIDGASDGDDRQVLKALKKGAKIDDDRSSGGWTALACAAGGGKPKTVALLLDHGAYINSRTVQHKETPLIIAARKFNLECVRILIDRKAGLEAQDTYGETALVKVGISNDEEIARLLLKNGANINAKNRYGETILTDHLRYGRFEQVKFLLDNGADIGLAINGKSLETYANLEMRNFLSEYSLRLNATKEIAALNKKEGVQDIIEGLEGDLRK